MELCHLLKLLVSLAQKYPDPRKSSLDKLIQEPMMTQMSH